LVAKAANATSSIQVTKMTDMRFRLRTLMIVVTVAGVCLGWVGNAPRQTKFHRQRASAIAQRIVQTDRHISSGNAIKQIRSFAAGRFDTTITYHGMTRRGRVATIKNGPIEQNIYEETALDWRDAIHHQMMADTYDSATYRPWMLLSAPRVSGTTERTDTTTPKVQSLFYKPLWKRDPPPPVETLPSKGAVTLGPQDT
jgi:hypothetical protein